MKYKKYKIIFDQNDGVIKSADLTSAGYHNSILETLIHEGFVVKIKAGYYEWQYENPVSDAVVIKKLFPDGIVCLDSALYLYGYTDRTPLEWHLAVSKNSSKSRFKIDYPPMKFYFLIERFLEIGVTEIEFEQYKLKIFDRDRTICDVIRYEKKMDKEVYNKAIRAYLSDSQKNIANLIDYAKEMNVEKKVNNTIGMWM